MCDNNVVELFKSLCRALANGGRTRSATEEFLKIETNRERVEYARNLLREFDVRPRVVEALKSEDKSLKCRDAGNKFYQEKKDEEALRMYTEGVANAPVDSEHLGLAYGNRSAVLFKNGLYRECLEDISNALQTNYPERLINKLYDRKRKAEELSSQQQPFKLHDFIPNVSFPNSRIKCASQSITLQSSEEMGRSIVSTTGIAVGEVVAEEKPYAKILLSNKKYTHCHHCLKLCYILIHCTNCTTAMFCGDNCKNVAWKQYHKYECPLLSTFIDLELGKLQLMALRVAICARQHFDSMGIAIKDSDEVYESENYKEIHQLVANTEKRSVSDLFERATVAAVLTHLMDMKTDLFEEFDVNAFQEVLMLHLQTAPSNFHEITEAVYTDGSYQLEEVAAGAYSFLSLLNHACSANVVRHCYGTAIVLRALRPIPQGEQLFDNYGYHHALMPKADRQKHLSDQYHFTCDCIACKQDWPLYHDLPAADVDVGVSEEELEALRKGDEDVAKYVADRMKAKLTEIDKYIPCIEVANAQEIMKQCFAVLANKRPRF